MFFIVWTKDSDFHMNENSRFRYFSREEPLVWTIGVKFVRLCIFVTCIFLEIMNACINCIAVMHDYFEMCVSFIRIVLFFVVYFKLRRLFFFSRKDFAEDDRMFDRRWKLAHFGLWKFIINVRACSSVGQNKRHWIAKAKRTRRSLFNLTYDRTYEYSIVENNIRRRP